MKPVELKKDIYWVGGIDWDLRNFHGYQTQRGSTYNAYLILDEKITLVDTVKHYLVDEMVERISQKPKVEAELRECGFSLLESIKVKYIPEKEELNIIKDNLIKQIK